MKKVLLVSFLLCTFNVLCQDTIFLNPVKVSRKSIQKLTEIKRGFDKNPLFDLTKDFTVYDYYEKIEFPFGTPHTFILFFRGLNPTSDRKNKKLLSRNFTIDLFHADKNGSIGSKINNLPIEIYLPESNKLEKEISKIVSLKEYNLFVDALYIRFSDSNISSPGSDTQYWPLGYRENGSSYYRNRKKMGTVQDSLPEAINRNYKLRFKMKILADKTK